MEFMKTLPFWAAFLFRVSRAVPGKVGTSFPPATAENWQLEQSPFP